MKINEIYSFDILFNEKSYITYKNILKTFMSAKPLRIWFDKIDGFIKTNNRIRC